MGVCVRVSVWLWLCVEMSKYILISFSRLLFTLFAFTLYSHLLTLAICDLSQLVPHTIACTLYTQRQTEANVRTHTQPTNVKIEDQPSCDSSGGRIWRLWLVLNRLQKCCFCLRTEFLWYAYLHLMWNFWIVLCRIVFWITYICCDGGQLAGENNPSILGRSINQISKNGKWFCIIQAQLSVTINFGFNLLHSVFPRENNKSFYSKFTHLFLIETYWQSQIPYHHLFQRIKLKFKFKFKFNDRTNLRMKDSSSWNGASKNKRLHTYEWIRIRTAYALYMHTSARNGLRI